MPRNLVLQSHISIDGYVASNKGSDYDLRDWITTDWTPDIKDYVTRLSTRVDTILLGRKTAEDFIPAWRGPMRDAPGADFINSTPKIVFSNSLSETSNPWGGNARIVNGDVVEEVKKIKAEDGRKDIIVYGGVRTVQTLVAAGLVDEMFCMIDPWTLGEGGRLFVGNPKKQWDVLEAKKMDCGSVVVHYRVKE